jgi:phosphoglucomutase
MGVHPLAGQPAPETMLVDVNKLLEAYRHVPDPAIPGERVSFGTSGHRGSSLKRSFNEHHILAVVQAICEYRHRQGTTGPLFVGIDTHALSRPAFDTTLEVLAGNGVEVMVDRHGGYTPTPVVSHAILTYNRGRSSGHSDGIVITPSHNPPEDGGIKYNPPQGGPADTTATKWIEERANSLLAAKLQGVIRRAGSSSKRNPLIHEHDYIGADPSQ